MNVNTHLGPLNRECGNEHTNHYEPNPISMNLSMPCWEMCLNIASNVKITKSVIFKYKMEKLNF